MGIVADISNSNLNFGNPPSDQDIFNPVGNFCRCIMHSLELEFAFDFDPDPKKGVGGAPSESELWRIGIVQNVVFERMKFEYSDGGRFEKDFTGPVVDSVAATYKGGFYADPVKIPACSIDPKLSCNTLLPMMTPVADIVYDKTGYGELMAPGGGPAVKTAPKKLDLLDEPKFGARMRKGKGTIVSAEHIITLQDWLVAKTPKSAEIIAYVEPFSLVFVLAAQPRAGALSIDAPPFQFNTYGKLGIVRSASMTEGGSANIPILPAVKGKKIRQPILDGQTANERGRGFLQTNGLLP